MCLTESTQTHTVTHTDTVTNTSLHTHHHKHTATHTPTDSPEGQPPSAESLHRAPRLHSPAPLAVGAAPPPLPPLGQTSFRPAHLSSSVEPTRTSRPSSPSPSAAWWTLPWSEHNSTDRDVAPHSYKKETVHMYCMMSRLTVITKNIDHRHCMMSRLTYIKKDIDHRYCMMSSLTYIKRHNQQILQT